MNKLCSTPVPAAACLLFVFAGAPSAFANCCLFSQTVTFSVPGASQTVPTSINSSGAVAGYYYRPGSVYSRGGYFGFLRDPDGTITTFAGPGEGNLVRYDPQGPQINDSGVITGSYVDANGVVRGFVGNPKITCSIYSVCPGGIVSFDAPGSTQTWATGINASGWVVGSFSDAKGSHGFLYCGGTAYPIDFPGAQSTFVSSVTSSGYVVGVYSGQYSYEYGFWCFMTCSIPIYPYYGSFAPPGGPGTAAWVGGAIWTNSSLVVAGTLNVSGQSGYLGTPTLGNSTTFQFPGSTATEALGINSSGTVVGDYSDSNGGVHGFLRNSNGLFVNVDPTGTIGVPRAINNAGAFTGLTPNGGFVTFP